MEYWSWWIGAIALGSFVILYGLLLGKPLGVSGSWMSVARWRESKELQEAEEFFEDKDQATDDLLAATLAEFGEGVMDEISVANTDIGPGQNNEKNSKKSGYTPAGAHLVFLVTMFLGSFITTALHGGFELHFQLSELHSLIFGNGWEVWIVLLIGGMMVGFGTQMAGGCTSGHGLSGCAQFIPASLTATFIFFASAVVFSVLIKAISQV